MSQSIWKQGQQYAEYGTEEPLNVKNNRVKSLLENQIDHWEYGIPKYNMKINFHGQGHVKGPSINDLTPLGGGAICQKVTLLHK